MNNHIHYIENVNKDIIVEKLNTTYTIESIFVKRNLNELVFILTQLKKQCENNELLKNIINNTTWNYKNYDIFTLCAYNYTMNKLQKILHSIVKLYLNEFEIKNKGFIINSWLNYHTKLNELLTTHTHHTDIHGYINITPLASRTIMSDFKQNDIFYIENQPGLIYINQPNEYNLHRVEVHSSNIINNNLIEPRITIAFNIDILPRPNNGSKQLMPNFNSYSVYE